MYQLRDTQLRRIAFDRLPTIHPADDETADLVLADAPLLMTSPRFDDYAFLLAPGEYALSRMDIKTARSVSDVQVGGWGRERLIADGKAAGGSFTVGAGEVVYIGHFYVDCAAHEPILWRYYPENRAAFDAYLAGMKKKFPALDTSKAQFRLFKTRVFGYDFELE